MVASFISRQQYILIVYFHIIPWLADGKASLAERLTGAKFELTPVLYRDALFPWVSGKCSVAVRGHDLLPQPKPPDQSGWYVANLELLLAIGFALLDPRAFHRGRYQACHTSTGGSDGFCKQVLAYLIHCTTKGRGNVVLVHQFSPYPLVCLGQWSPHMQFWMLRSGGQIRSIPWPSFCVDHLPKSLSVELGVSKIRVQALGFVAVSSRPGVLSIQASRARTSHVTYILIHWPSSESRLRMLQLCVHYLRTWSLHIQTTGNMDGFNRTEVWCQSAVHMLLRYHLLHRACRSFGLMGERCTDLLSDMKEIQRKAPWLSMLSLWSLMVPLQQCSHPSGSYQLQQSQWIPVQFSNTKMSQATWDPGGFKSGLRASRILCGGEFHIPAEVGRDTWACVCPRPSYREGPDYKGSGARASEGIEQNGRTASSSSFRPKTQPYCYSCYLPLISAISLSKFPPILLKLYPKLL